MKEEKSEKESKLKKKISKIIGTITVSLILMITAGCGIMGMGSKSWIEKQVSDIEKVYPTENPEDLFEKFPIGFTIYQSRIIEENGKTYSIRLEVSQISLLDFLLDRLFLYLLPYLLSMLYFLYLLLHSLL